MIAALPTPPVAADLLERREDLRMVGKKLVLTNGCFDLLHPGHISYLAEAAVLGDELWVGINGDQSVRALKGDARPVLGERERAFALRSLRSVDEVFVFPNARLTGEIRTLCPDIYVKAGDYTLESLNPEERAVLEETGAEIRFLPFIDGFSTTDLIARIKKAF